MIEGPFEWFEEGPLPDPVTHKMPVPVRFAIMVPLGLAAWVVVYIIWSLLELAR